MDRYSIEMFWSPDDGGFIATVPDLPGCSAFGETRQQAAIEIAHAIEASVEARSKAEAVQCTHADYSFAKHGRYCPCGVLMADFGD
jgi:predicted RNase H-like HicB family nuclease